MKKYILLFISLLALTAHSQELNCKVTVNANAITSQQISDRQIFADLQTAISDFMNTRRWTNDIFAQEERIKCNLLITLLKSPQQNVFNGNAQFQVVRPVYGTNYETMEFSYVDRNFSISFAPEERQMIFNEQTYRSNLTSILATYALVALAIDYDTFSKLGGNPYVQRAYNVVNLAGNANIPGWKQEEDQRNRFWLVENLQNQLVAPFREGMYYYHRTVLDNFSNDPVDSRKQTLALLSTIRSIQNQKPVSVLINSFIDAKGQEIINMFSEAPKEEKDKVFQLLSAIDPAKTEMYRKLSK
jgi:hypothetical protein